MVEEQRSLLEQGTAGTGGRPQRGRLFVVSGPSGVGKDTVLEAFHRLLPDVKQCVTVTTRRMRPGESQGHPYLFLSVSEFQAMLEADGFLEYAKVNGNLYGTPRAWVEEQRSLGYDTLLKIDVQGGLKVRHKVPDAVLVFLAPPTLNELERRLRDRNTETEDQIGIRLVDARSELEEIPSYDYLIINDFVERAADDIRAIFIAERRRVPKGDSARVWTPPHE
jgi:guanylate kinase